LAKKGKTKEVENANLKVECVSAVSVPLRLTQPAMDMAPTLTVGSIQQKTSTLSYKTYDHFSDQDLDNQHISHREVITPKL